MVPSTFDFGKMDWKGFWDQKIITEQSFKGSKFPSKDERDFAWNEFQRLVNDVNAKQAENQKAWERKKDESARLKELILSYASSARPYDSGLADLILIIVTGGAYLGAKLLFEAIMGPLDEEKQMLKSCSELLQKGWVTLHDNKERMLGKDKGIAYQALKETEELIDKRWGAYKVQRQQAWDKYQHENTSKHNDWKRKVESNIRTLEERREKLRNILAHKERHLDELYVKLREAWSDDYRSRVSGWIREEESDISDIKEKLRNIEDWIYENKDKLR